MVFLTTKRSNGLVICRSIRFANLSATSLDWIPNRDWIFSKKITERNRELMKQRIGNYRRKLLILYDVVLGKSVHDKMPWELTIRPELLLEE